MTTNNDLMTAKEVAEFLGMGINQVYEGAANDQIPAARVGRRWLFHRTALLQWLGCKASQTPESE